MSSSHSGSTATPGTTSHQRTVPARGVGAMHDLGPLLRACQGEATPVVPHVRSGELGAKVQRLHDRSNRRDDWHALLPRYRRCDTGPFFRGQPPPTRPPGLPAGQPSRRDRCGAASVPFQFVRQLRLLAEIDGTDAPANRAIASRPNAEFQQSRRLRVNHRLHPSRTRNPWRCEKPCACSSPHSPMAYRAGPIKARICLAYSLGSPFWVCFSVELCDADPTATYDFS